MNSVVALLGLAALCLLAQGQDIPPPPFLQGQPADVIQSFQKVLEKGNQMTDTQLDKEVEKWVESQSPTVKQRYVQFKTDMRKHQQMAEAAHKTAVEKFSPAAKEADTKLSTIANSPSLTSAQKNEQIQQFVAQLPPSVRQEIETAMQG